MSFYANSGKYSTKMLANSLLGMISLLNNIKWE